MAISNFACVTLHVTYHWCEKDATNLLQKVTSRPKILCHRQCAPCTKFSNDCFEYLNTWWKTYKKSWGTLCLDFFIFAILWNQEKMGKSGWDTKLICAKRDRNKLCHFCIPWLKIVQWDNHWCIFGQKIISNCPNRSFGGHFWCPDANQKRNRNDNLGKLIDLSSVSTHYGHCNVWIENHLNTKHSDHVHMTPCQFAFSDQLCTSFARKWPSQRSKLRSIFAPESNATFTYGAWADS